MLYINFVRKNKKCLLPLIILFVLAYFNGLYIYVTFAVAAAILWFFMVSFLDTNNVILEREREI